MEKAQRLGAARIGTVNAVYLQETKGYWNYVIELLVEQAAKGEGLKKGDFFRAFCYQRKEGAAGLEFDTEGHKTVPKEGQRVNVFVNQAGGQEFSDLEKGTRVYIHDGPFAGYEALFDVRLPGSERVRVLIELLSKRYMPVEMQVGHLRKVESKKK